MSSSLLTSKSNPVIERTVSCRDGKNKDFLFVEGETLFEEAILSSLLPTDVICVKEKEQGIRNSLKHSKGASARVHVVDPKLMKFVSDLESPPGIVALMKKPFIPTNDELYLSPLIVLLHRVQLPQNVGALMRTAEATGIRHFWSTKETADPYSPKTIRGSAGSVFRLKIRSSVSFVDTVNQFKEEGYHVLAAVQGGKIRYDQVNWKQKAVLVVGNEGAGFSADEIKAMTNTVYIPMAGDIESLNVSIAGSVCLYEAFRQRGYPIHGT